MQPASDRSSYGSRGTAWRGIFAARRRRNGCRDSHRCSAFRGITLSTKAGHHHRAQAKEDRQEGGNPADTGNVPNAVHHQSEQEGAQTGS